MTWLGGVNGNTWVDGQVEPNSINWTGATGVIPDNHFYNGDNVTFNDSGTTLTPVVSGTVNPGSITFANGVGKNYTVTGGAINSGGPATFSNAGSVTLSNTGNTVGNLTMSGSGNVNITSGSFTVNGTFIKNGGGTLTFSNSGEQIVMPSIALNNGTLTIDRTDDLTVTSGITGNLSGGGTFRKQNTNVVDLSGDNSGFTGTTVVANGTLNTRSANALTATTVISGATLDMGNNGIAGAGGGTKAVSIAGDGVGGLGALTVTTAGSANGNNAHVGNLTLAGDATIRVRSPDTGVSNRAILWVDGIINGGGKTLTAIVDTNTNTGLPNTQTEIDFVNNGITNLGNINLSGGGAFFIGGTTDLGPTGVITLGDPIAGSSGSLGVYGNTNAAGEPVTITKPITVSSAGGTIQLLQQVGSAYTISSPITLDGNLFVSTSAINNTVSPLVFSGTITGSGNLDVHLGSGSAIRAGLVSLTSNNITYSGLTTIGGSANDHITLSVNGSHVGGGAYTVNTSGTLGGTGMISADVTVNSGGTLAPGVGVGTLSVGSALFNTDGVTNGKLLIEYDGDTDTIDKLAVTGALDITNATLDFDNLGVGVLNGSPKIFASYDSLTGTFTNPLDLPLDYTIDYNYLGSKQIALIGGPAGLAGDYNNNGVVDAADYVVWRKGGSPDSSQAGYNLWRSNFGNQVGSGNGSGLGGNTAVPEPGTILLVLAGIAGLAGSGRGRCRR